MIMSDVEGPQQLWRRLLRVPLVLFVLAAGLFSFFAARPGRRRPSLSA
jgi:preprotein translocase subunit YajC